MGSLSIIVPSAKFSAGASTDALGAALTGTNGGQGGEAAGIPALYAMWDYSSDLKLGLALNSPFGLVTSYDDNWVGRYHATTSSLKTFNLQPTVAYKLSPDRVPRRGVRAAVLSRSPAGSAGFMLPARPTA
jgi:long-chain fatty acid transport protein